jgi:hypothetical protein
MPAAGPGFGGIVASSLLGSMAGTVLGTMIAQSFLANHAFAHDNPADGVARIAGPMPMSHATPTSEAGSTTSAAISTAARSTSDDVVADIVSA